MGKWMGAHKAALIVSTLMFAFMAMFIMEIWLYKTSNPDFIESILDGGEMIPPACLLVWRLGGFVTWPVFIYMLLRPRIEKAKEMFADNPSGTNPVSIASLTCIIAAVYGGGGLWLVGTVTTNAISWMETADQYIVLTPILALLVLVLPFAYLWGFVALYGTARTRLEGRQNDMRWVWPSIGAAIIGVFLIGVLIYAAIVIIMIPVALFLSASSISGVVSQHLSFDLLAMAISSGNFASQWYGFKKVDEKLDPEIYGPPAAVPVPPRYMQPPYGYYTQQVDAQYIQPAYMQQNAAYAPQPPMGYAQWQPMRQPASVHAPYMQQGLQPYAPPIQASSQHASFVTAQDAGDAQACAQQAFQPQASPIPWTCPNCGSSNDGKFCPECATPRPQQS